MRVNGFDVVFFVPSSLGESTVRRVQRRVRVDSMVRCALDVSVTHPRLAEAMLVLAADYDARAEQAERDERAVRNFWRRVNAAREGG